ATPQEVDHREERHAALQHRRELTREERDVPVADPAPAAKRLPLDLVDPDALTAEVRRDDGLRHAARLAADRLVVAVDAFPDEQEFLGAIVDARGDGSGHEVPRFGLRMQFATRLVACRCGAHQSLVTASISSSDVIPDFTLSKPDWRNVRTPSFAACSAMSIALPLRMMSWRMSSVIGITSYTPTRPL